MTEMNLVHSETPSGQPGSSQLSTDPLELVLQDHQQVLQKAHARLELLYSELAQARKKLESSQHELEEACAHRKELENCVRSVDPLLAGSFEQLQLLTQELKGILESASWKFGSAITLNLEQLDPARRSESIRRYELTLEKLNALKNELEKLPSWQAVQQHQHQPAVRHTGGLHLDKIRVIEKSRSARLLGQLDLARRTTVVVPIYNSLSDLRLCVESVLEHTQGSYRLLLVNDCSSDPEIAPALEHFARENPAVEVITTPSNLGFVGSANLGMRAAAPDDVVLLNSDTIVTPRWLQKLRTACYWNPKTATATPFSNAAGAFSVPTVGANEPIPIHLSVNKMARLVERVSHDEYPKVPTGNGFCMYIRRDALEQANGFDEQRFGRGYGEENDFCMRLRALGWNHVIADSLFIYHRRSASFGSEREDLIKKHRAILDQLHPTYTQLVSEFVDSKQLAAIRKRILGAMHSDQSAPALRAPRILFVLHGGGTGGVNQTTADLASALSAQYDCLQLLSSGNTIVLNRIVDSQEKTLGRWTVHGRWSAKETRSSDFSRIYLSVLLSMKPDVIHIRHLFKHSFDLPYIARQLGIPLVFSFHDFYFVCPSIHLLDQNKEYCGGHCTPGLAQCTIPSPMLSDMPLLKEHVGQWRHEVQEMLANCDVFVTTSKYVREVHLRNLPTLAKKPFRIIEHGRDIPQQILPNSLRDLTGKKARILIAGNLDVHKGSAFIAELAKLDGGQLLDFHFLGTIDTQLEGVGTYHGPYKRAEFAERARSIEADFAAVFSLWPETWSHTLTEAWGLGLPVFGAHLGAVRDRIEKSNGGWIVDCTDPAAALQKIRNILANPREIAAKRRAVRNMQLKSVAQMAAEYAFEYEKLLHPAKNNELKPVALLMPERAGASSFVRVLQPLRHETARSRLFCFVPDHPQNANSLEPFLDERGISTLLIQRNALSGPDMLSVIELCKRRGFRLVCELDDDLLNISSEHPEYEKYLAFAPSIQKLCESADTVIVSTESLKKAIEPHSNSIRIIRNRLDEGLWFSPSGPLPPKPQGVICAGYIGSFTHDADLRLIAPAVTQAKQILHSKGITLRLFLIGGARPSPELECFERITVPASSRSYSEFVRWLRKTINWDFGLAPLSNSALNESKSELKFLEYTALGMPGIYSRIGAYSRVLNPGVDALLVENAEPGAWVEAIVSMASESRLRSTLLENARRRVQSEYLLAQSASELCDVLTGGCQAPPRGGSS